MKVTILGKDIDTIVINNAISDFKFSNQYATKVIVIEDQSDKSQIHLFPTSIVLMKFNKENTEATIILRK